MITRSPLPSADDAVEPTAHQEVSDGDFQFAQGLNGLGRYLDVAEKSDVGDIALAHFVDDLGHARSPLRELEDSKVPAF